MIESMLQQRAQGTGVRVPAEADCEPVGAAVAILNTEATRPSGGVVAHLDILVVLLKGALSERRLAMMVDTGLSGLPAFLTSDAGLSSGFMSGQIAAAAMVAENRQKAHPASVDSIPTVANQEDHVSMATYGARRLTGMVETLNNILAIELLASVEGTDHVGLALSPRLAAVKDRVRARVPRMNKDRWFAPDYDAARHMVKSGEIAEA